MRFTYSTNGQGIYGIDMETGTEGEVQKYPTPDELWDMIFTEPNPWRDRFAAVPLRGQRRHMAARYYQEIAVERVLEAIADER